MRTFEEYSRPLLNAMAALPPGERVVFVAHSHGWYNVALAVERFPDRVAAAVTALSCDRSRGRGTRDPFFPAATGHVPCRILLCSRRLPRQDWPRTTPRRPPRPRGLHCPGSVGLRASAAAALTDRASKPPPTTTTSGSGGLCHRPNQSNLHAPPPAITTSGSGGFRRLRHRPPPRPALTPTAELHLHPTSTPPPSTTTFGSGGFRRLRRRPPPRPTLTPTAELHLYPQIRSSAASIHRPPDVRPCPAGGAPAPPGPDSESDADQVSEASVRYGLVVEDGRNIPAEFQRRMVSQSPGLQAEEIAGADHMAMLSWPQKLVELLIRIANNCSSN
ncbi:unnamed protein product [Urochloa decumbens]|uniref:AB hydrolase-1 domain-containing protein n=1 Tax=Urochloa decumbens TaxID=240449 RepID=A0ABC8W0L6_9POAL